MVNMITRNSDTNQYNMLQP